ncbi:MAG TPA: hypothetical protein VEL06_05440 [Haliangiales bacterium]|nr:hypothetical protein [Haliangiales bacterium]
MRDQLEGEDEKDILWDDEITQRLADFQKVAVRQAVQIVKDYGGAFVSDVVGLGLLHPVQKGAARSRNVRPASA